MRGWPWRCGAWRGTTGLGNGLDGGRLDRVLAGADCEMGTHGQRVPSRSAARRPGRNPTRSDPRGAQLKRLQELEKVASRQQLEEGHTVKRV